MMQWKSVSNLLNITLLLIGTRSTASFISSSSSSSSHYLNPSPSPPPQQQTKKQHSHYHTRTSRCSIALKSAVEKRDTISRSNPANPSSVHTAATASAAATKSIIQDVSTIALHASFCIVSAAILSFYEGYDCAYLKPQTATIRNFPTTTIPAPSTSTSNNFLLKQSTWETRTASPTAIDIMKTGTRGMGRGRIDRLDGWYQNTYFGYNENEQSDDPLLNTVTDANKRKRTFKFSNPFATTVPEIQDNAMVSQNHMREIRSYNEIMEEHRLHRIPTWRHDNPSSINSNNENNNMATVSNKASASLSLSSQSLSTSYQQQQQQQDMTNAVGSVYRALQVVNQIKVEANDYNWDKMKNLLESPILRKDLLEGCSVLRGAVGILDNDARTEIGFDWGSCAWRHCGANADAQESLAELYNNAGMLEPFECLFTLDIVERSLRDILAVVPTNYHPVELRNNLKAYVPYQQINSNGYSNDEDDNVSSTIDDKFINTLSGLRNDYSKSN